MHLYDEVLKKMGAPLDQTVGRKVLLVDMRAVYIEGHRGLTLLTDEEIRFRFPKKELVIFGSELKVTELSVDEAYVEGKITKVGRDE